MDLEQLRALESEFNSHAKKLVEIHNQIRDHVAPEVPVQERFFFYTTVVSMPMIQETLDQYNLSPEEITSKFVKDKIDVAIMDETPFDLREHSGYCNEIIGG